MSQSDDRLTLTAGVALLLLNRLAVRARLRRRADGWRRGAGLVFRGEATTFVLSAFGLDSASDLSARPTCVDALEAHLAQRLQTFLASEMCLRVSVARGKHEDHPVACSSPSYTLRCDPAVEGAARFVRPDDWHGDDGRSVAERRHNPLVNIVARVGGDGSADLWLRVNHVGADGVPIQEMLARLEAAWGGVPLAYPTPCSFAAYSVCRPCCGRPDLAEVQTFVDFAPLLTWRKKENAHLPEPMTLSAALLWRLARQGKLANIRMGTTVDVPPQGRLGRSVGMVIIRPADYFDRPDGLERYVRDFNQQLELNRRRSGRAWELLDAIALLPGRFARAVLAYALTEAKENQSLVLTIVKDAKVFGAPISDVGSTDGVIAIGGVGLPSSSGPPVGCVTIKGPAAKIAAYPRILADAIRGECPQAS